MLVPSGICVALCASLFKVSKKAPLESRPVYSLVGWPVHHCNLHLQQISLWWIGDHCFYFSENVNVSWSDAVTQCANNLTADRPLVAGNLVSIHDSMETDFLVSLMRGRHHYDFWIGLHAAVEDTGSYRQWVWSDQSRYGFTNWRFGENENWSSQKASTWTLFFCRGLM